MSFSGLTSEEAKARLLADGFNQLPSAKTKNLLKQFLDVLREPMLLLLMLAGVINFLLSELLDGSILLLTVVIILGISTFQARKTEKALAALKELSAPKALVIRDSREMKIPSIEVVRGDLISISEGDRVPADAQLVSCTNLFVDESMLTGESLSVHKTSDSEVFSGTLVVSGHATAIVKNVGIHTLIGQIGKELSDIQIERTRLQKEVDQIVRVIAVLSIIAAILVVVLYGITRGNWLEGTLAGIAASMALLPEEFPVVLTVFMALGAWRLSKVQVITRRAPAIETLGSVTVLCVDKTGTLTMNQMSIDEIETEVALYGLLASPEHPFDPMDKAFHSVAVRDPQWKLIREYPLTDALLAICQVWQLPNGDRVVAAKGAPEAISRLCNLDLEQENSLFEKVNIATNEGFRVLGVARSSVLPNTQLPESPAEFTFSFLGIAKLHDPVRPFVSESVQQLKEAGVRTIMLTGDYSGTALAIAREIGLETSGGVLTGNELNELSDEELAQKIKTVNIFARVVPSQKLRLIRALKIDGEIVGMTGDGVNDAPALKAADIGIAMGRRGTDVARESASLVITDDDFTSIAHGVQQGRRIYANLRKAMSYVIAVHVPIFGMTLIPVFYGYWPLVLLPAQIAFLELIIDPASSVVFEAEQADANIMKERPRRLQERILNKKVLFLAISQGLSVLLFSLLIYFWALDSELTDETVRSLTFATLMIGNLVLVFANRSQYLSIYSTFRSGGNKSAQLVLVVGVCIIITIFNIDILQDAFNVTSLTSSQWLMVIGAAFASMFPSEIAKFLKRKRALW